jgi:putative flippase GtrA
MKVIFNYKFIRYCIVGIVNTIVGYSVTFGLMFIGVIPEISSLIGFVFGILCSYILNKQFTFKNHLGNKYTFWKFIFSMVTCYFLSLAVLILFYRILHFNPYLSQIFAGVVFTLSGFILSKFCVFKV